MFSDYQVLGKIYKTFSRPEHDRWHQREHDKKESMVWYVVVVTTTTCRQLGNDTTNDTEKKKPTSHDVADTSAVSGRRVGKTRRHVFKTNCGQHLKRRHFQLRMTSKKTQQTSSVTCLNEL